MKISFLQFRYPGACLIFLIMMVSCRPAEEASSQPSAAASTIVHEATDAASGVTFRVELGAGGRELSIREPFDAVFTSVVPDGVKVAEVTWNKSDFEKNLLGQPSVVDESYRVDAAGVLTQTAVVRLDAELPEAETAAEWVEYTFPETYVMVTKKGQDASGAGTDEAPVRLAIPPFPIQIRQLTPEEWADLEVGDELECYRHLDPAAFRRRVLMISGVAAAVLLVLVLVIYGVIRRRRRLAALPPPPIPPEVKARAELQSLLADNLPERGEFNLFYTRISSLMRTYIEEKFHINAPEQTTQEFLAVLTSSPGVLKDHRRLLKAFLQHCDMVKFAEMKPEADEVKATVDDCSGFIDATCRPVEATPAVQSDK